MKPVACRIHDFRAIKDSGVFTLSGDNITVLAGQNEAGKTAVLLALRDFDLPLGSQPETPDFMPEDNFEAVPRVAVQFRVEAGDVDRLRSEIDFDQFFDEFVTVKQFWIERNLVAATYFFDSSVTQMWDRAVALRDAARTTRDDISLTHNENAPADEAEDHEEDGEEDENEEDEDEEEDEDHGEHVDAEGATLEEIAAAMRNLWPSFVYFDTFADTLPRSVDVDALLAAKPPVPIPQSVRDFIALADIDVAKVKQLSGQEKSLGNYLDGRGASITGDFLSYWQQRVDGLQNVFLRVRAGRDEGGRLKLSFFVRDQVDQYPEQRSRGFLWFLSFYLRLAAERKHRPDATRILLIDEPGSYLHARAQRDVLHLFENRIAPQESVIYSSHSPFLMPSHTLHRIRIVVKSATRGTRVYDRLTHPDLRGPDFADTLTPLVEAIGIDVSQAFTFHKPKNLLVEGITDHIYITTWASQFASAFLDMVNVLPGFGATTLLTLASLFIGWGQPFGVLLDRDDEGLKTRDRFDRELLVPDTRLVLPKNAITLEDIFSAEDFKALLAAVDPRLTLEPNENPSACLRRQSVDKVLLARTYAERVARGERSLTKTTQQRIEKLFAELTVAVQ